MQKIVLLGATGMAGQALSHELTRRNIEWIGVARRGAEICLDITSGNEIIGLLDNIQPTCVINAAALTDIGKCETNPSLCWGINTIPISYITEWGSKNNAKTLQISTDHYYGEGGAYAHHEKDQIQVVNQYAASKYAAECIALTSKNSLVLRTSILGRRGWGKKTLFEWIWENLRKESNLPMFKNVWTSSLEVNDFARIALSLLIDKNVSGLINVGSRDVFSKKALIEAIAKESNMSLKNAYPTNAKNDGIPKRSFCLGLNVRKAEKMLGSRMPSLAETVKSLLKNK